MENTTFHGPPMIIGAGSGDIEGVGDITEGFGSVCGTQDGMTSDPCEP